MIVIAFLLQGITGMLMMIYYTPNPDQAHASTIFIIQNVSLGWLLESVHHYGAYAMILLTFLHLLRAYLTSAHKEPRQMMWVIGMLMGVVVLGSGFTGYLLPWTVVSKSATDVAMGLLNLLPAQIGSVVSFLLAGNGSNAAELSRFFELHVVVLPAALAVLLLLKAPWFPTVYLYRLTSLKRIRRLSPLAERVLIIGCVLLAAIFAASAMYPFSLPAEFSPAAAADYVAQPEWYFLWIYQVLKFEAFEGSGINYALGAASVFLVVLTLMPFFDRNQRRTPWSRPVYTTIGLVITGELLTLTVWGQITPGQVIPDWQAVGVIVIVAIVVATTFATLYRGRAKGHQLSRGAPQSPANAAVASSPRAQQHPNCGGAGNSTHTRRRSNA